MNAMIAATVYCIVGCNTGSPDKDALRVLECDTETGAAKIVQSVSGCEGTTYFQLSKDGKTLYSVVAEKVGDKTRGALVKFALDGHRIGKMTKLAELPCETPCHVALSPRAEGTRHSAPRACVCLPVTPGRGSSRSTHHTTP